MRKAAASVADPSGRLCPGAHEAVATKGCPVKGGMGYPAAGAPSAGNGLLGRAPAPLHAGTSVPSVLRTWDWLEARPGSLPGGSSSAPQTGPTLGPLHPLPDPDKAPRLEVPILWQKGQMAGTKLTLAPWSSAVLWPGRALGKRCRAKTLPTATRSILPEDTARCESLAEAVGTTATALAPPPSPALLLLHLASHAHPMCIRTPPGSPVAKFGASQLCARFGAGSSQYFTHLHALTPPPCPCSPRAPQEAGLLRGAELCPQVHLGDVGWKGETCSNTLLHAKVDQVGQ